MVKARIDTEGKLTGYYDFITESIRPEPHQETIPVATPPADMSVENIKLLIKGAMDKDEAMLTLLDTKQPTNIIQKYLTAVKNGMITFPV
jgi:hypothetical protein